MLPPGTLLKDSGFSIGKVLGRGGFGITYLGADLRLKRAVAIKEFFPAGSGRAGTSVLLHGALSRADYDLAIRTFMQEAQMLARFRHRSIVSVYEVFQQNDTAYMAMEYLQGEHLLERMDRRGRALDEAELIAIAGPVAEALDEVHAAGVLHRDIKPENIMLVGAEGTTRPVLIDFGAAREFASGMVNRHSIVLTPGYAPLEQYSEQARRGPFTDIFALAATLYHLATAEQPPAATDRAMGVVLKAPRTLNPTLTLPFDAALMHGLEMKVDLRPQQALTFYQELTGAAPTPSTDPASPAAPSLGRRVPKSPPIPASPQPQSHLGRVQQIAHQLTAAGAIQTDRFLCPVCRAANMVDSARSPLGLECPVCRASVLQQRVAVTGPLRCPSCVSADLVSTSTPLARPDAMMRCPACRTGAVVAYMRTQLLIVPDVWAQCDTCGADFDYHTADDRLTLAELPRGAGHLDSDQLGQTRTRAEWAAIADEGLDEHRCPACDAEFRPCSGGGLEWVALRGDQSQVPLEHRGQCRPRVAWAKIAGRVPLDAGSVACPACDAQFDEVAPGQLTLLSAPRDPYGTTAAQRGRTHPIATWRSLGAGGGSPAAARLVCPSCTAQLEEQGAGDIYALVSYEPGRDPHAVGARYQGKRLNAGDWRRIAAAGVPVDEERRLRDVAHREFWAALLAGEVATSTAEASYPATKAAGEKVVIGFGAVQVRSRFGFSYLHDEGHVWLTTKRLYYRGDNGDIDVPLREAAGCEVLDMVQTADAMLEIHGRDGSTPFRCIMGQGPMEYIVEGLTLQLRWDEEAFAELFEALRSRA